MRRFGAIIILLFLVGIPGITSCAMICDELGLFCTTGGGELPFVPVENESMAGSESFAPGVEGELVEEMFTLPGNSTPQMITYEVIDNFAIYQGDIVLGKVDPAGNIVPEDRHNLEDVVVSQGISTFGDRCFRDLDEDPAGCGSKLWPNRTVYYDYDDNVSDAMRDIFVRAITHMEENTPLVFQLRIDERDYIRFTSANGCSSAIGRQGGRQRVRLASGCGVGSAVHEILHAIGIYHEQSRSDRDDFVSIDRGNVRESRRHNYDKHTSNANDLGAYDYASLMHYNRTAFARRDSMGNPLTVMTPTRPLPAGLADIGQRSGLSQGDIATTEIMYPPVPEINIIGPSDGDIFEVGTPINFEAIPDIEGIVKHADRYPIEVEWRSDIDGVLGRASSLRGAPSEITRSDLSIGDHIITATARITTVARIVTTDVQFGIRVQNSPPVVEILADGPVEICQNEDITLRGRATDPGSTSDSLPDTAFTWRSNIDGVVGTGPTLSASLSVGVHTIELSVMDAGGEVGVADIAVNVIDMSDPRCTSTDFPPTAVVVAPEDGVRIVADREDSGGLYALVRFEADVSDAEDSLSDLRISWSSTEEGILGNGRIITAKIYIKEGCSTEHTVAVIVRDTADNVTTDSIRVTVWTLC